MKITKINQGELRDRLLKFINETGTKYVFVAAQIDTYDYVLSHFRHGRHNLWDSTASKLDEFLKKQGY